MSAGGLSRCIRFTETNCGALLRNIPGPSYQGGKQRAGPHSCEYSTVVSVVINVRKGEFTEKAAIAFGRERLVGPRVESYPAIAAKKQGVLHCLIGNDVYPLRTRRGKRTVVVKLNDCSDLSVCAE